MRAGDLQLVFRHWNVLGPESTRGAKAALAAAEQDAYWQYLALLIRNRETRTEWRESDDLLAAIARESGVSVEEWGETSGAGAWAKRKWERHLRRSATFAREHGMERPPGYLVEGPGGRRIVRADAASPATLERAVEAVSDAG